MRLFLKKSLAQLVLIRGLPGSGKSTLAQEYVAKGFAHIEADMYFVGKNGYQFDSQKSTAAHIWCQKMVYTLLHKGKSVVVSNTFTQLWEMEPYLHMHPNPIVVETTGSYQNIHGVPADKIAKMQERWEIYPPA